MLTRAVPSAPASESPHETCSLPRAELRMRQGQRKRERKGDRKGWVGRKAVTKQLLRHVLIAHTRLHPRLLCDPVFPEQTTSKTSCPFESTERRRHKRREEECIRIQREQNTDWTLTGGAGTRAVGLPGQTIRGGAFRRSGASLDGQAVGHPSASLREHLLAAEIGNTDKVAHRRAHPREHPFRHHLADSETRACPQKRRVRKGE